VHEAIARARRQGRYRPLDEEPQGMNRTETSVLPDPERQAFGRELASLLEAAVDELPDGSREVFVLREVEGLSTGETAQVLGVSDDVVKARLSRAKAALRRDLLDRAGLAAHNAFTFHRSRCDRIVTLVFARLG
jgi:RNA polymerase sigma-70 factor (ECF subfamily)